MQGELAAIKAQLKVVRGDLNRLERLVSSGKPQPIYADLATVSRMFGFGQDTLRSWCNQGKIKKGVAKKVMGKWLISLEKFNSWIEEGKG